MTVERVLVDAGPLVALLSEDDAAHLICAAAARDLPLPLVTTWLVLAEAAWLLRRKPGGVSNLLRLVDGGVIQCADLDSHAPSWMIYCLERYADLRPQLADISLVFLANREGISTVFTLDRRDFSVFRTEDGRPFSLVPEVLR